MWIEAELNGHPAYRRERATEIMRRLRGRGFDDEEGRHLLRDRGEIGQSLAGNALPQVLPDVAGAQVLLLLSEVQEVNWTSFEKWKARSIQGQPRG